MTENQSRSIVIIEEKGEVKDRVFFAITNSNLTFQTHHFFSIKDACDFLNDKNHVDMIVLGNFEDEKNYNTLFKYLNLNSLKTPIIAFDNNQSNDLENEILKVSDRSVMLAFDVGQADFENEFYYILTQNRVGDFAKRNTNFKKVKIVYFLRFNKALCDIYIKLSEDKYVKIINAGDEYKRDFIYKFTDKRVRFLFISEDDYEKFSASVLKTPFLIYTKEADNIDNMELCSATLEIIHDLIFTTGISPQVIKLVDTVANKIESDINRKNQLRDLLFRLKNRRDYLYDHSYLVAYLSIAICREMEWDSESTRNKLTYAAVFHDVLIDDSDLAFAFDLGLDDLSKYTEKDIEHYKKHPELTARMISECNRLPPNIDKIVLQHHERPNGTGFPRRLSATNISKLSGIFNLCHEFVNEMYRYNFEASKLPTILRKLDTHYSKGNYRDGMAGIKKALKIK